MGASLCGLVPRASTSTRDAANHRKCSHSSTSGSCGRSVKLADDSTSLTITPDANSSSPAPIEWTQEFYLDQPGESATASFLEAIQRRTLTPAPDSQEDISVVSLYHSYLRGHAEMVSRPKTPGTYASRSLSNTSGSTTGSPNRPKRPATPHRPSPLGPGLETLNQRPSQHNLKKPATQSDKRRGMVEASVEHPRSYTPKSPAMTATTTTPRSGLQGAGIKSLPSLRTMESRPIENMRFVTSALDIEDPPKPASPTSTCTVKTQGTVTVITGRDAGGGESWGMISWR